MYLREIIKDDELEIKNIIYEIENESSNYKYEGVKFLENYTNIDDLSSKLNKAKNPINKNFVPQFTYCLVDDKNHIYGFITLRINLCESLLKNGGNIGYGIRPSERKKGYGKLMLKLGLNKCKELMVNNKSEYENKVLITCRKDNISSSKTIISNGGILEKEEFIIEQENIYQYYWINV